MKIQHGTFEDSPYRAEWFEADDYCEFGRWEVVVDHCQGGNEEWDYRLYQALNPELFVKEAQ